VSTTLIDLRSLPSKFAPRFLPLLSNKYRNLHLCGGAGSSKSHSAAQKYLVRIMLAAESRKVTHKFLWLRKTAPAARGSLWTLLKRKVNTWNLDPLLTRKPNETDMLMTFTGGHEIKVGGLDEPHKIESFEGITGIWFEEALEFTPDDIRLLNLRMRGNLGTYFQNTLSYNPRDITHQIYDIHRGLPENFTEGAIDDRTYVHYSSYLDNPFLDEEYKRELLALEEQDPEQYSIYALNKWGKIGNQIFTNYVIEHSWPSTFESCCYGLDFGFNNPTALCKVNYRDGEPWVEQVLYESHLNNNQLIEEMGRLGVDKGTPIYADEAEPARIQEIGDAGYDIYPASEAKRSVRARLDYCRSRRVHIRYEDAELSEEIQGYKYRKDRNGNVLEDPVKFRDHAIDAWTYGDYEYTRGQSCDNLVFSIGGLKK
jgi:phage terminase large subunit